MDLSWAILGCPGPVLDHLEAWGPSWDAQGPSWAHFGVHFGAQQLYTHFFVILGVIFWTSFRQFLDQFWSILGPDRPQQGPRLAPQLIQNWSHFWVRFWITFYRFCDLRRLPSSGTLSRKVPRASLACAVPYISFYSWAAVRMPL